MKLTDQIRTLSIQLQDRDTEISQLKAKLDETAAHQDKLVLSQLVQAAPEILTYIRVARHRPTLTWVS